MTIIETITNDLETVTEGELQSAARILPPADDDCKALGVLHSMSTRKLLALSTRYRLQTKRLELDARGASSKEEEDALMRQSRLADAIGDVFKDLFWVQARIDIGDDALEHGDLSVRDGWMIMQAKCDHCEDDLAMPASLKKFVQALKDAARKAQEE